MSGEKGGNMEAGATPAYRLDKVEDRQDKFEVALEKLSERFSAEVGELRRTIIQAMVGTFIAAIGIIATLARMI